MPPSRDLVERIQRLRGLFVDEGRGADALADYWRSAADLAAYDAVLGARIGWKWDAALAECRDRGFPRADAATVLDFGCGSGVASRRFVHWCGAREVLCHDRSRVAAEFAVESLRAANVRARAVRDVGDLAPDVLLVSHVLGELDDAGERALDALIARSQRVVVVEPGSKIVARRLSALRDALLGEWCVVALVPRMREGKGEGEGDGEREDVRCRHAEAAGRGDEREAMSTPSVPLVSPVRDAAERAVMARRAVPHAPSARRRGDRGRRHPWAELLRRVFLVDVLVCPHCRGARRLLAVIHDPVSIERVLRAMGLPTVAPALAAARSPPVQADLPW